MKRLFLVTLFLSFFGFSSSVLAYDTCQLSPDTPLPCTFNGVDYKSMVYSKNLSTYCPPSFLTTYTYVFFNLEYHDLILNYFYNYDCYGEDCSMQFVSPSMKDSSCPPLAYGWTGGSLNICSSTSVIGNYDSDYHYLGEGSTVNLQITCSPELGGGVSDYPVGENIYCGIDGYDICEKSFPINTQVTLDADPNEGYEFSYWEINGLAMADVDGSIEVTMDEAKNVVAVFYLKADDFVFPVLAQGVTDPLQNKFNPIGDGWHGPGVGEHSAEDGHLGQDYVMDSGNGDGNAAGEPVYAIANGIIVEVMNDQNYSYGWCDNDDHGWGPVVVIRHESRDGFDTTGSIVTTSCDTETNPTIIYSLYGHLSKASIQNLQVGQVVRMGDQLGVAGAYGVDQESWTTNHLHFELKDEAGYTEGIWYKTPANEGVCPESTNYPCDSYLVKGVGTAYSMGSNFAPHRYEPGAFINLNDQ
ncbi:MAG: M23 family peptidase [Candidatus Moranbacteria bacterium GW2011_GWF2_34_56]|nr:MAG: M23 family peptidase [Candidatus Moranbacteria bacterium GW2011_GWF1_34_10]KKP63435.1 MAG: M23 family peptidase [Candidatus Moranbacteria bacterium GW2011_GWF2_34_56]HBI17211.1 hypothetical protein [Candidatus Moranbacteria bacterium]